MKKIIVIALFCLLLSGCILKNNPNKYLKKSIGIDISSCKIIKNEDAHGGFLGDGTYFIKATCSKSDEILKQISKWKELPLSKNLSVALYGTDEEDSKEGYWLIDEIPEIKNGYYYFKDRYADYEDREDDKELFNRYSFNFTIAVYDTDTNILYYYEMDT